MIEGLAMPIGMDDTVGRHALAVPEPEVDVVAPDRKGGEHEPRGSFSERLALQLANRSFWGRGGTGSEEQTPLYRLPAVDRLALEMAANEDIERRALHGELETLHAAWRDAEEIAAIADELFSDGVLEEFKRQYFERLAQAEE